MSNAPSIQSVKAKSPEEAAVLRVVLGRGPEEYTECPCGWFYLGARCPDKKCKEWLKATGGKKTVKLYAHGNSEDEYHHGKKLGLEGEALTTFSHWSYELEFEAEVDLQTGKVKLLTVDGYKVQY